MLENDFKHGKFQNWQGRISLKLNFNEIRNVTKWNPNVTIIIGPPPPPPTTHHHPHKLFFAISQPPVVRFERVRPFFDSTQSQESKSEVAVRNKTRQCALWPILRPTLYLWCPWSNPDMWDHFLHLQNLRNPNLRLLCATNRGNAH